MTPECWPLYHASLIPRLELDWNSTGARLEPPSSNVLPISRPFPCHLRSACFLIHCLFNIALDFQSNGFRVRLFALDLSSCSAPALGAALLAQVQVSCTLWLKLFALDFQHSCSVVMGLSFFSSRITSVNNCTGAMRRALILTIPPHWLIVGAFIRKEVGMPLPLSPDGTQAAIQTVLWAVLIVFFVAAILSWVLASRDWSDDDPPDSQTSPQADASPHDPPQS